MEEVANKYKLLIKKLKTRENGSVVESMNRMGLKYPRNFGVAIGELKKFAKEHKNDNEFALFLWQKDYREAKLLSLMTANPEELLPEQIDNYVAGINNVELAEQASLNLLSKIPDPIKHALSWCNEDGIYIKLTGLLVISQVTKTGNIASKDEFEKLFDILPKIAIENNFHIKRGLSRALFQISKQNEPLKVKVLKFINSVQEFNNDMALWLQEEVVHYLNLHQKFN